MNAVGKSIFTVLTVCLLAGAFVMGRGCGAKSAQSQISSLSAQLAESEKTVQLKDGLYATELAQVTSLQSLLDGSDAQVKALKDELAKTQAQLLDTQQIALQWKNAYEGQLAANQSTQGQRTRVDFSGKLGPIAAQGYTLTDPAEAHLSLRQIDPLLLTVSVARQKDGKWTSYVTTSDPNIDVKVKLGGVDPGAVSPSWQQRIWLDAGIDFLGGRSASLGASYHFDRWSLGFRCSIWEPTDFGCGLTAGFRIFN